MPQTQREDLEALRQEVAHLTEDLTRERRDLAGMQDERNEALGRADVAEGLVRDLRADNERLRDTLGTTMAELKELKSHPMYWAAEAFEERAKRAEAQVRKLEAESTDRLEEIKALVRALNDADRRAKGEPAAPV
jgi:chromosome segregation ATPase